MYLHIGQNVLIPYKNIIGIFDFDQAAENKKALAYLKNAEEEHIVIQATDDVPKSYIVCSHPYHRQIVYLSQISASTLYKSMEIGIIE